MVNQALVSLAQVGIEWLIAANAGCGYCDYKQQDPFHALQGVHPGSAVQKQRGVGEVQRD